MKKFLQKFGRLLLILGVVLAIGIYFLLRYFAIDKQPFPEPPDDTVYYAADGEVTPYETLDQNLNWEEQQYLWFLSQGSEIIPYSWFTHLEQKDTTSLFRSVKNMSKFGFTQVDSSTYNPSGLPVGFSISNKTPYGSKNETTYKESYVGLTCSACHSNQLSYEGKRYIIDGAPSTAYFIGFLAELLEAMIATSEDPAKFERFANKIIGEKSSKEDREALHIEFMNEIGRLNYRQEVNSLPDLPLEFTGHGRIDAFGNIQNAVGTIAIDNPNNRVRPDAPVSLPFLWGTHQSDFVQWIGSASNEPINLTLYNG